MEIWKTAKETLPAASEWPASVWVCIHEGGIASAIYKHTPGEASGEFCTLDGSVLPGVLRWMPRKPDRLPALR